MSPRDDDRTARQIARSKTKKAGDRSARIALTLMKLADAAIKKLEIDDDLRETIVRARAVTSQQARRRAERTLAGELRRFDLVEIDEQLAKVHESSNLDVRQHHLAEQLRAQLIEQGVAAAAAYAWAGDEELPRMIEAARSERDTRRPPGAARKLFRHILELLKTQP